MKNLFPVSSAVAISMVVALSSCSTQEERMTKPAAPTAPAAKAEAKAAAPAKAKAEKATGDVGLIDTEKNYMILVTKQGKLVTLDFDQKTKVTRLTPTPAKMTDIGLGNSATVTYSSQNNKNIASGIQYKAKK
jgi:Cu/Ag efflux protein CusF